MTLRSSIRQWFVPKARAKTNRPRALPDLEVLEDRLVPAGPVFMIDVARPRLAPAMESFGDFLA
jgi:hypothetical protein